MTSKQDPISEPFTDLLLTKPPHAWLIYNNKGLSDDITIFKIPKLIAQIIRTLSIMCGIIIGAQAEPLALVSLVYITLKHGTPTMESRGRQADMVRLHAIMLLLALISGRGEILLLTICLNIFAYTGSIYMCDLITPYLAQPIYFKYGGVLPDIIRRRHQGNLDPRSANTNMCAWNCIFAEPLLAQKILSTNMDGSMHRELLNELIAINAVRIYDADEAAQVTYTLPFRYNPEDRPNYRIPKCIVRNGHMEMGWSGVTDTPPTTDTYTGLNLGAVLPNPIIPGKGTCAEREQIISLIDQVIPKVDFEGRIGRIAEMALIALLEECDLLTALSLSGYLPSLGPDQTVREYGTKKEWHVYDSRTFRWMTKKPKKQNTIGWDGNKLVDVTWIESTPSWETKKENFRLVIIDNFEYRSGYEKAIPLIDAMSSENEATVELVEGVPGCGKTSTIVDRHVEGQDVVVVATREAVNSYKRKEVSAVTFDSLVINGWTGATPIRVARLDEGLMLHSAAPDVIISILAPERVEVFGDRMQIPFICRVPDYKQRYTYYPWDVVSYMSISYENPKVVCDVLRPYYDSYEHGNDRLGVINISLLYNATSVPPGYQVYLTFTKGDKDALILAHPDYRVFTIHEQQGERYNSVAMVRLTPNAITIFDQIPHIIVGVSRTRSILTYFTCQPNDTTSKILKKKAVKYIPTELEVITVGGIYEYNGGAFTPISYELQTIKEKEPNSEDMSDWLNLIMDVHPRVLIRSLPVMLPRVYNLPYFRPNKLPHRPTVSEVQMAFDNMYHRRLPTVLTETHHYWPNKWPEGCVGDIVKMANTPQIEPRTALQPRLITPQPPRAQRHDADLIAATNKRILGDFDLQMDYGYLRADELFECFCRTLDNEKLEEAIARMPYDGEQVHKTWLATRDGKRVREILATDVTTIKGDKYYAIVRGDHKVVLNGSHEDGISAGQLVTAHTPFWTSLFAPYFTNMTHILRAALLPNIIMHTQYTWEELSAMTDAQLSGVIMQVLEVDISKYDKSQMRIVLDFQCKVYEKLGMPKWAVELWRNYHEKCIIIFPQFGIHTFVNYQRRTGDAATWLGNTIVLLGLLAFLYPIERSILSIVGGDDSTMHFKEEEKIPDQSQKAASLLNFELKVFAFRDSIYFSSRFLVLGTLGWVFVGDPVKIIARWGRNDIQGDQHVVAIWESMCALHYHYLNDEYRTIVTRAAEVRYKFLLSNQELDLSPLSNAIANAIKDLKYFRKFFLGTKEEWALTLDPRERETVSFYHGSAWEDY